MGELPTPAPEQWLADIHLQLGAIEKDAIGVAGAISRLDDKARARKLRAEWSRFVGHTTELAVVVSDMLDLAMHDCNRRARSG